MHRPNTLAWYAAAMVCAVLLALLAAAVATGAAAPFDSAIRAALHRHASTTLTQLALLLSFVGSAWIWIPATVLAIGILWFDARGKAALALLASMAGAVVLDNGLKLLFHRARPLGFFAADPRTYSFPSGHALFAACFYGALAAVFAASIRKPVWRTAIWAAALLMILGIGLSRMYLGVHYPSDVLAGYLTGAAWVASLYAAGLFHSPTTDSTTLANR